MELSRPRTTTPALTGLVTVKAVSVGHHDRQGGGRIRPRGIQLSSRGCGQEDLQGQEAMGSTIVLRPTLTSRRHPLVANRPSVPWGTEGLLLLL